MINNVTMHDSPYRIASARDIIGNLIYAIHLGEPCQIAKYQPMAR